MYLFFITSVRILLIWFIWRNRRYFCRTNRQNVCSIPPPYGRNRYFCTLYYVTNSRDAHYKFALKWLVFFFQISVRGRFPKLLLGHGKSSPDYLIRQLYRRRSQIFCSGRSLLLYKRDTFYIEEFVCFFISDD